MSLLLDLYKRVQSIPDYGPVAELAKTMVMIRGRYPYEVVPVACGSLDYWRAVILEAMILDLLKGPH